MTARWQPLPIVVAPVLVVLLLQHASARTYWVTTSGSAPADAGTPADAAGSTPVVDQAGPVAADHSTHTREEIRTDRNAFHQFYIDHGYHRCEAHERHCILPLRKTIDCREHFTKYRDVTLQQKPIFPPPREMPQDMVDAYTIGGVVKVENWYFQETNSEQGVFLDIDAAVLSDMVARAKNNALVGGYGATSDYLYRALAAHPVAGLHGAVFGTQTPWVEAFLFGKDAAKVTTIEFRQVKTTYTGHTAIQPWDWANGWLNGTIGEVDFAVSFSSFEHDGLGRYGDPLDPWGDVSTLERVSCYIKQNGLLYLAVPVGPEDQVVWNAHRVYARFRWPLMASNWAVEGIYTGGAEAISCATFQSLHYMEQPVVVLRNTRATPCT